MATRSTTKATATRASRTATATTGASRSRAGARSASKTAASRAPKTTSASDAAVATRVGNGSAAGRVVEGSIDLRTADLPLGADATDELAKAAPAFGAVLRSIGLAVAASQAALDRGVVKSVEALREKKVDVVTDVVTELDDDGRPKVPTTNPAVNGGKPSNLRTANVSVLNFFTPTVHEWKHVALSMDLAVGELDASQGVKFSHSQASVKVNAGLHWGFFGWFAGGGLEAGYRNTEIQTRSRQETDWAQGTVRVDAELGPRRTTAFPVPGRVERGPTVVFMPGAITRDEAAGTRALSLKVESRKANGAKNGAIPIQLSSPGLAVNGTTTTGADGTFTVTLTKPLAAPTAKHTLRATLGSLIRTFDVTF